MSGLAERIVELAADQLPEPERSRRSEEWSADLEGAKEHGLSRLGIAFGALIFAIGAPVANPMAADRWARWALVFATIGPVVWFSLSTSGLFMSNPPLRDAILVLVDATSLIAALLVIISGLRTRGMPWVASAAIIMLCVSCLLWFAGPSRFPLFAALLALAVAGFVVVAVRLRRVAATSRGHVVSVLALASLPVLVAVAYLAGPFGRWIPLAAAAIALLVVLAIVARTPRAGSPARDVRIRWATVSVVTIATIIIGMGGAVAIATMTWAHPVTQEKLWAALTPEVLARAAVYAIIAVATALAYLGVAAVARRRQHRREVAGLGFALAAALGGAASDLPHYAPWAYAIAGPLSNGLALIACSLSVVGFVLLVVPTKAAAMEGAPARTA